MHPDPHPNPGTEEKTSVAKLRRRHRKSRNGCLECKRRHIKCDEKRPTCSNCTVSERSCSFPPSVTPGSAPSSLPARPEPPTSSSTSLHEPLISASNSGSRLQSPVDSVLSTTGSSLPPSSRPLPSYLGYNVSTSERAPSTTLPSFTESFAPDVAESPLSTSQLDNQASALPPPLFTNKHLILLHHFRKSKLINSENLDTLLEVALEWSSQAPYALDQLLAISADHMAVLHPESAASYRRTATELQTRALSYFNKDAQEVASHDTYYIPRFLFSSLLSLHMLYDTLTQYRSSFHIFIDRFCESVHLHRGVRSTTNNRYHDLLETRLATFFLEVNKAAELGDKGDECAPLIDLIQRSDLHPASVEACINAANTLQWAFNVYRNLPQDSNVQAVSAFPVVLGEDFIEAIRKHRPEALLVLAYYGALLHRCRHVWLVGDSGAFLIHLIANHLGSYWQEALQWPLQELENNKG
ncbi:sterol uptake control 2 [Fusarium longipes]|uniref:Sterol uptake control 2 n=1 Tax=Fusarium longipes TaxID=694270 RepID=A0A395RWG8_9HYPO|nr:sterol uptake control 2 [Fusarium longipes]